MGVREVGEGGGGVPERRDGDGVYGVNWDEPSVNRDIVVRLNRW